MSVVVAITVNSYVFPQSSSLSSITNLITVLSRSTATLESHDRNASGSTFPTVADGTTSPLSLCTSPGEYVRDQPPAVTQFITASTTVLASSRLLVSDTTNTSTQTLATVFSPAMASSSRSEAASVRPSNSDTILFSSSPTSPTVLRISPTSDPSTGTSAAPPLAQFIFALLSKIGDLSENHTSLHAYWFRHFCSQYSLWQPAVQSSCLLKVYCHQC